MQWLTFSDAQNYGIDVKPFAIATGENAPQPGSATATHGPTSSAPEIHSDPQKRRYSPM
jgi:hypothetical protein